MMDKWDAIREDAELSRCEPIQHGCGCVEMDGKWSSICEEHSDINLRLEADARLLAAKDAEIERLRKLVSDVASVAEASSDQKFDGCEHHRKTALSIIADDCRKHLDAPSAGGSE